MVLAGCDAYSMSADPCLPIAAHHTAATIRKNANITACGRYRYHLSRYWLIGPALPFVMLNPSTADAEMDDPTIRRCMSFARREGASGLVVVNLFAWRSFDPYALLHERQQGNDIVGPENDDVLKSLARYDRRSPFPIVCAWGAHEAATMRGAQIAEMLSNAGARLACLGRTAKGHPRHPLYVKGDQPLEAFA